MIKGKEIEEIIGQAIGEGSMCWDEPPIGIFDSVRASRIIKETISKIMNTKINKFKRAVKEIRDTREADKRKAYEEKMDEWFYSLSVQQQADVAYNFWDGASYEDKKEEYELE